MKIAASNTICVGRLERKTDVQALFSPEHWIWLLSAGFALAALLNWFGPGKASWTYPPGFREVTGTLLLVASVLLLFPMVRLVGGAIAALVMFLSATTLLHRGQYAIAAPVIALLFALVPVSLGPTL